jgi:hypothetical protein
LVPPAEPPHVPAITTWLDRSAWLWIAFGSALRVLWPLDMEWKYDEKWMFATAVRLADGRAPWPWVGMPSGVKLRNPGLSIWQFAALARVFREPVAMAQAVQAINVLALWGLALWVVRTWMHEDRALGLWSIAAFAVSPLAVLFSRKIWAQDLLIVFVLAWLWFHRKRERPLGAALWGASGALLGQVHMSGFFAAAALAIVTAFHDRRRFPLIPWLAGSALGALPLVPWLSEVWATRDQGVVTAGSRSLQFFAEAIRHAFGLGLAYPLGREYRTFLRGPGASHVSDAARYGLLALLGLGLAWLLARAVRAQRGHAEWTLPEPVLTYGACVLLTGLAFYALRVQIFAHYLIVFGPMLHICAAWLLYPRRSALLALCALQAFLSFEFLHYIHQHGGAPASDYGPSYATQSEPERSQLPE